MQRPIVRTALAAALTFVAMPAIARSAVLPERNVIFTTSEVDVDRPNGALEGSLNINIFANGTLLGYFRPADGSRLIDVHGGITGKRVFVDIGGQRPIVGTYDGTTITGYRGFGSDLYRFTAIRSQHELL
jgi:hypothetical protein